MENASHTLQSPISISEINISYEKLYRLSRSLSNRKKSFSGNYFLFSLISENDCQRLLLHIPTDTIKLIKDTYLKFH